MYIRVHVHVRLTSRPKGCSQPRELWFFDILMYNFMSCHIILQSCTPTMGSTDVWQPLHALQLLSDTGHAPSSPGDMTTLPPRSVFLVSDGHMTEEGATLTAIRQGLKYCRLFTFGVRSADRQAGLGTWWPQT